MAFGFIKKVFSFGRKEEPKPQETPPALEAPQIVEAPAAPPEPVVPPVEPPVAEAPGAPPPVETPAFEPLIAEPSVAEASPEPPEVFEPLPVDTEPLSPEPVAEAPATGMVAEALSPPPVEPDEIASPEPAPVVETFEPLVESPEPAQPEPELEAQPEPRTQPEPEPIVDRAEVLPPESAEPEATVAEPAETVTSVPVPGPASDAPVDGEAPFVEPVEAITTPVEPESTVAAPASQEPLKEPVITEEIDVEISAPSDDPIEAFLEEFNTPDVPEAAQAEPQVHSPPPPAPGKVTVQKTVERKAEPVAAAAPEPRRSWFQRMRDGLSRSSRELTGSIAGIFTRRKLDEDTLQDLEDVLIRADLGMETALRVTDTLSSTRYGRDISDAEVRTVMAQEIEKVLAPVALPLELDLSHKPHVILVVGVNGTGKTTTIGKLAAKLHAGGLSVTLGAGDTFRAAAIEQLKIWGERTHSPVVSSKLGADAAGLAYDAFEKAKAAGSDVLIIDTAGRLQNRAELMAELEKIVRVLGKLDPEAPHTVLQTVDATTGQNALNQVEIFRNVAGVNGLVMTKLDGTARGGILVAIAARHRLPVYFIGVGEQVDDLEPFSAADFAKAIAGIA